jgi:hypothetical protein
MWICFLCRQPLPKNTRNSFQNVLNLNGFVGEDFVFFNTPKEPNNRMSDHQKSSKEFLSMIASKRDQIEPGKISTTSNHLYTSTQIDQAKGHKTNKWFSVSTPPLQTAQCKRPSQMFSYSIVHGYLLTEIFFYHPTCFLALRIYKNTSVRYLGSNFNSLLK